MSKPEQRSLKKKLSFVQKVQKYFDDSTTDIMINEATIIQPQIQIKKSTSMIVNMLPQPQQFNKGYEHYHNEQPLDPQPELDTQHK